MRIAILCDGRTLAEWQRRAVELIAGRHELYLLACEEPPARRSLVKHALYYALNLATIRNRLTRRVPFPAVAIAGRLQVTPQVDGNWAALPQAAWDWLAANRVDAVLKFGLDLMRVADDVPPILSYHHGDPRSFRGRPAGYYELERGEPFIGQVVQILSNKLDGGEVLAFSQTRAAPHSYRRTLVEAYALSPLLLPHALAALETGQRPPIEPRGPIYRLPPNASVIRFVARRIVHALRRLGYGAFVEKRWRVSLADAGEARDPCDALRNAEAKAAWRSLPLRPPHRFHADPLFYGDDGVILLEALNGRSGKGELLLAEGDEQRRIGGVGGHVSYPASIDCDGRRYLLPEISEWSSAAIFRIDGDQAVRLAELDIDAPGLLDPTLFWHDGKLYLFANRSDEGPAVLRLWLAEGLFGRFTEHPASPIRCSIRGSRMGGPIRRWPAGLIRIGQDFRTGYGDGVLAFSVTELTATTYREEDFGAAGFGSVKGPHTIDVREGSLLFDWYEERFDPLAGVRRLLHRL